MDNVGRAYRVGIAQAKEPEGRGLQEHQEREHKGTHDQLHVLQLYLQKSKTKK